MGKIVILNGPSEGEAALMECLRFLFPECEIEVQSGPIHRVGGLPTSQEPGVCEKRCGPQTIPV